MCYISIHFLYTEEDLYGPIVFQDRFLISIHFLYTEEDSIPHRQGKPLLHFNPLPLYRGRQRKGGAYGPDGKFQSTSSIQRKTVIKEVGTVWGIKFQSTSSIQRKTIRLRLSPNHVTIFQSTSSIQRKTNSDSLSVI